MNDVVEAEVVPTEPTDNGGLPVLATPQVTPAQAAEMVSKLNEIISSVLKPGHDYDKIPGTPKPSLLQPGAEQLQRFFGLGSKTSVETGFLPTGEFYARATVSITNSDGLTLAEQTGWCDDTEKGKSGPKWRSNKNTIIQMASKRGYVSAIKRATGTSDHFTQDVEQEQAPPPVSVQPDKPASVEDREVLAKLFAERKPTTLTEAHLWIAGQGEAKMHSRNWVAANVLALLQKPVPSPTGMEPVPPGDASYTHELPPDPAPEPEDDIPF